MDKRVKALDGLRGFAAFSVFLSHAGFFNISTVTTIPAVIIAYNILAVGTNGVQILFVLSGFLMAFLFQDLTKPLAFIRKRYTRIFPVFIVIVTYLWFMKAGLGSLWWQQLLVLGALALLYHFGWRMVRKYDSTGKWRAVIFYGFVMAQLLILGASYLFSSEFSQDGVVKFPLALIALSNMTLTTDFVRGMPQMSAQFWSLVPEVFFYILFPFLVVPMLATAKKWGWVVGLVFVFGMTKIIFDLQTAFVSYAGLNGMQIARASGFVAGVVLGTIYRSQGKAWNSLVAIFKNSWIGLLVFTGFIFIQWAIGQSFITGPIVPREFYYLASSWIIALVIVAAIIPGTILNKMFSNKAIVFFGIISYSVYLIHIATIDISQEMFIGFPQPFFPTPVYAVLGFIFALGLTTAVSYFLFKIVESMYFADKHINREVKAAAAKAEKTSELSFSPKKGILLFCIFVVLIIVCYSDSYSPSLTVSRNSFAQTSLHGKEAALLQDSLTVPFTSKEGNLSAVVLFMRYKDYADYTREHIKKPAKLVFQLYSPDKKLLSESAYEAFQVEGQLRFPFAFPTIPDSKNKQYIVKLSLVGGSERDQLFVNTSPTSFVSIYTHPTVSKAQLIPTFLINRITFALTNPDAQFALGFFILLFSLIYLPKKKSFSQYFK